LSPGPEIDSRDRERTEGPGKRVLITGAAGFVGRVCVDVLRTRGHLVVATVRVGPVDLPGDLSDRAFVSTLPDVDAVIHAAAVQYVSADLPLLSRTRYFRENNVLATAHLCERYDGRSTHFVNIGTSMMYAQNGAPFYNVKSPMAGQGVYSVSKLEALRYVQAMRNKTATLIPCIIGGVGREGLFRSFVSMMTSRGVVVFPGTGRHKTSMVHVQDVASLLTCIVESTATGYFNAAAPRPLSIQDWIDEIERELDLKPVRRIQPPLAPIHALAALSRYRLLAREQLLMLGQSHVLTTDESIALGWQPRHDNAAIVRDIARYIAGGKRAS
jgi:nucleoside-diphosphate-sugar epimerase